jgi:hypothetical protein
VARQKAPVCSIAVILEGLRKGMKREKRKEQRKKKGFDKQKKR